VPSQLLRKWLISPQLDRKLQPLPGVVVEDPIGKTVGRITVQDGDGLDGAKEAMLQAGHYIRRIRSCSRNRCCRIALGHHGPGPPATHGRVTPASPKLSPP
jgi:hypothetical protein